MSSVRRSSWAWSISLRPAAPLPAIGSSLWVAPGSARASSVWVASGVNQTGA